MWICPSHFVTPIPLLYHPLHWGFSSRWQFSDTRCILISSVGWWMQHSSNRRRTGHTERGSEIHSVLPLSFNKSPPSTYPLYSSVQEWDFKGGNESNQWQWFSKKIRVAKLCFSEGVLKQLSGKHALHPDNMQFNDQIQTSVNDEMTPCGVIWLDLWPMQYLKKKNGSLQHPGACVCGFRVTLVMIEEGFLELRGRSGFCLKGESS